MTGAEEVGRFRSVTASQKVKAVLRVLEGTPLQEVAREMGVSAERLARWKQEFLAGGRSHLMRRKDGGSRRAALLREQWLQWGSVVLGLVVVIWAVTRFFAGASGGE